MRLCDHIPYILPLVCFDMSGISCRLLLVPGSFQYLHMKAGIPTERPGGGTPHMKGVEMLVGNFELNP